MTSHAPPSASETAKPSASKLRAGVILCAKCVLAGALLWWLVRSGRFDWRMVTALKPSSALAGVLCFQAAMLFCIAARWHFLARALGLDLSLRQTSRISLIGFYAAIWTPASLGLDGARLLLARGLRPGQNRVILASVLWDRILGLWSLLLLCVFCGAFVLNLDLLANAPVARRAVMFSTFACAALAIVMGILMWKPQLLTRLPGASRFLKDLPAAPQSKIFSLPLLLAFATHACNLLATFCALRVFEINAPLAPVALVSPFVVLSSLLPLTPLGLGVTDAAAALLFEAIGVSQGANAAMLGRTIFVLLSLACGLAWLVPAAKVERQSKVSSSEP